jgi:hypothetical protein
MWGMHLGAHLRSGFILSSATGPRGKVCGTRPFGPPTKKGGVGAETATTYGFPQVSDGGDRARGLRCLPPRPSAPATRQKIAALVGNTYVSRDRVEAHGKAARTAVRQMRISTPTVKKCVTP